MIQHFRVADESVCVCLASCICISVHFVTINCNTDVRVVECVLLVNDATLMQAHSFYITELCVCQVES